MNDPSPLLGRFRFQQSLAKSGKSVAWIARDEESGRQVVVGSLPIPRARTLVPLVGWENPHLARVHHVLDDADPQQLPRGVDLSTQALVVAEHVSGRTLHQRVETASVPIPRAVNWLMRLARALKEIHARGAVLGAISPRSVIVVRDGVVPVFTHLMAPPSGAFCSPGRVQGGGPSPEDDVWALTGLLYLALARAQPFRGGNRDALAKAILNADFAPIASRGVDDAQLQAILETSFQLDGSGQTAAELEQALVDWIRRGADVEGLEPRVSTRPPPPVARQTAFPPGTQPAARPASEHPRQAGTSPGSSPSPQPAPNQREALENPPLEPVSAPLERYAPISFTDEATAPALPTDLQKLAQAARPSSEMPAVNPPGEPAREVPAGDEPQTPLPPVVTPARAWDDHTAPALPSDIRHLAQAHAALAAGERALRDAARSAEHPRFQDTPAEQTAPAVPSARAPYSFADAEEETGRFTQEDLRELELVPAAPGGTNADEFAHSGSAPLPEPGLHPPTIVINEEAAAYRRRMDTLPPSGNVSQADIETQVKAAAKPAAKRTGGSLLMLLLAAMVAVGAVALLILRNEPTTPARPRPAPTQAPSATTSVAAPSVAAPPTPSPAVSSAPAAATDPTACVVSHFPEGTFATGEPRLANLCEEHDPRKLAKELHRKIVVGGQGQISAGMREWSLLSWYELAAIATIQRDCCPTSELELPEAPVCEPLARSLSRVASDKDDAALANLESQIACLYDKQAPRPYRYATRPDSGNKTAAKQFLERARQR
ncbi:MAG: hypothetical protein KC766_39300 [Myxococcales bacterium]|nr:hypothetical protein [Myxococcales bacterium]